MSVEFVMSFFVLTALVNIDPPSRRVSLPSKRFTTLQLWQSDNNSKCAYLADAESVKIIKIVINLYYRLPK